MNKSLANWLKTAIRSGHVERGYFQWQELAEPRRGGRSHVMNLYFKVRDGELALPARLARPEQNGRRGVHRGIPESACWPPAGIC
ncbi:hypothetical protein ACPA9J_29465 [Pseudomonas aeruginosa]